MKKYTKKVEIMKLANHFIILLVILVGSFFGQCECRAIRQPCEAVLWYFPEYCDLPCIPSKDSTCEELSSDEAAVELYYDVCPDCDHVADVGLINPFNETQIISTIPTITSTTGSIATFGITVENITAETNSPKQTLLSTTISTKDDEDVKENITDSSSESTTRNFLDETTQTQTAFVAPDATVESIGFTTKSLDETRIEHHSELPVVTDDLPLDSIYTFETTEAEFVITSLETNSEKIMENLTSEQTTTEGTNVNDLTMDTTNPNGSMIDDAVQKYTSGMTQYDNVTVGSIDNGDGEITLDDTANTIPDGIVDAVHLTSTTVADHSTMEQTTDIEVDNDVIVKAITISISDEAETKLDDTFNTVPDDNGEAAQLSPTTVTDATIAEETAETHLLSFDSVEIETTTIEIADNRTNASQDLTKTSEQTSSRVDTDTTSPSISYETNENTTTLSTSLDVITDLTTNYLVSSSEDATTSATDSHTRQRSVVSQSTTKESSNSSSTESEWMSSSTSHQNSVIPNVNTVPKAMLSEEAPMKNEEPSPENNDLRCTEAPMPFRRKSVKVYRQRAKSWHHARRVCAENGLKLMSVQNDADVAAILTALRSKQRSVFNNSFDVGGFRLAGDKDYCWLEGGIVKQKIEPAITMDKRRDFCLAVKFIDDYQDIKYIQDYCDGDTQLAHIYFLCELYE